MGGQSECQYVRSQEQITGSAGSGAFELFHPSQAGLHVPNCELFDGGFCYKGSRLAD